MVSREDYLAKIKELIIKFPMQYCPARENKLYTLTFNPNGTMEGENFTNWRILDNTRRGKVELRLLRGSDLCVWASLEKDGLWEGKDKFSGPIEVRTLEENKHHWKNLHDQRLFNKDYQDPGLEGIKYFDQPPPSVDWSQYAWNINDLDRDVPDNKTCIALAACNRIDYFKQVVDALAQNSNIKKYPVYCFLDRPRRDPEVVLMDIHENYIKQQIPGTVVIKRPRNFGCGRNLVDVRRQLFDNAGYERVFMFEDDAVPTTNYLIMVERLLDWAESTYSNVGIAQGWHECTLPSEEKKDHLSKVVTTYENLWGYLQNKQSWDDMKDFVYQFEKLFLEIDDYKLRPHRSILEWMKLHCRNGREERGPNPVPMSSRAKDERDRFIINHYSSCQDGATIIGHYLSGYERLTTLVNRMKYIGVSGIHSTPDFYNARGFGDISLDEFKSDSYIKKFEVV